MSYSTLKSRVNWPSLCTYFLPFQLFSEMETYPVSKSKNEQLDSSFIYNRGFPAKTKEAICRSTSQSRILAQGLLQRHLFSLFHNKRPYSKKSSGRRHVHDLYCTWTPWNGTLWTVVLQEHWGTPRKLPCVALSHQYPRDGFSMEFPGWITNGSTIW